MRTSWRRTVVMVATLAVLLGGCRTAPPGAPEPPATPSAAGAPPPALTLDQATAVLARAHTVAAAGDKTRTTRRLSEIYTGFELERSRTTVQLSRQNHRRNTSTLATYTFVPVQIWSSPADLFPQTALVQSRIKGRRYPKARVLHQLVRVDADASWLVAQALYPDDDPLDGRPVTVDGVTEALDRTTVVNGLRLSWAEQALVEGLNRPGSAAAKRFRGHPRKQQFADVEAHNRAVGHKQLDFSARTGALWLPAPDGGAVGLVPLEFRDTITAREDEYLTLGHGLGRTFDHHYQRVSQTGLVTCLVEVPRDGTSSVPDCEWSWGILSVTRGG